MRVGLVIYGGLETVSGGYLYDRKLVEVLRRAGDSVEILSLPWRNYARHLGDNLSGELVRRVRPGRYDVLVEDELNHPSLLQANRKLRGELPLVTIVHHLRSSEQRPGWQNRLYRGIERAYLRSVDGYIFNSRITQAAVQSAGVSLEGKPWVVALPAGDQLGAIVSEASLREKLERRAATGGSLRLLFVGNVIQRKGLHTLLDALERLPDGMCELAAAGSLEVEPGYGAMIQRRVEASPRLKGCVRLLGRVADSELAAEMDCSDVLAVPSTYEGYGIVYLEGMGRGLPAIGTTAGAAGEIITHGQDGWLVPPGDPAALAECIERLASETDLLRSMSVAARQRALAQPTWEETGQVIRSFLKGFV